MNKRWIIPVILLAVATLACTMTFSGKNNSKSKLLPTINPTLIGTMPPTITATPIGTLAPGGSIGTGSTTGGTGSTTNCTPPAGWQPITVTSGMTLEGIAATYGVSTTDLAQANCLSDPNAISIGQQLYVPGAPITGMNTGSSAPVANASNCPNQWFFSFDAGMATQSDSCPGPVVQLPAVGQNFEGGRVYRYAPVPGASDPRGIVYVIYNDRTWASFPDTWDNTQMSSDSGIVPPQDRYQPVESIGKIWRDNPDVRQRLGWAYAPQESFNGRIQQPASSATATSRYWYIDHGAWGVVLRLNSSGSNGGTWQVAGHY